MKYHLQLGQRVYVREDVETYGGLAGRVIHQGQVADGAAYRREHPAMRSSQGRLALVVELVVELEDPPPGLEPVILCYEDQVSSTAPGYPGLGE